MKNPLVGWDVGGAHLKAAVIDKHGDIVNVIQTPCPLWKGLLELEQAISQILQVLPKGVNRHAVTMTGELVDCFTSREQGVSSIVQTLQHSLPAAQLKIYAGSRGFLDPDQLDDNQCLAIASANWLASVQWLTDQVQDALFVDTGSTTTDILRIQNHRLQAVGYTDYQRLVAGELLYTGVVRTSVMAIASRAIFKGQEMGLMAEHFATMADVYRLTADLNPAHDQAETADGAEKTLVASARRLSRLTGYDFSPNDWSDWLAFALELKQRQKQLIHHACQRQLPQQTDVLLVGAGVGRFLLKEIANEQGWRYQDYADLFPPRSIAFGMDVADCAPAVAVACLAQADAIFN